MKKIKYIVPYDVDGSQENRNYSLAAKYKVDYIVDVLSSLGYQIEIISMASSKNKKGFYKAKSKSISKNIKLILCPTFGANNKIAKAIRVIVEHIWFFFWIISNTSKNDKVIVYHTETYINTILLLKKIKKINIILEIEEFYYKFGLSSKYTKNKEKKMILNCDKYILSNINQIKEFSEISKKPYCIVHGNYKVINKKQSNENNDKITIIFAGGIDRIRNSAYNAIQTVRYLNERYILKIIGYGSEQEINLLKEEINHTNKILGYEACCFCGTKTGLDLQKFYLDGDIALNLQNVHDYYMDFAFPSKILAYLTHGLQVVSTDIRTLKQSSLADFINFTESLDAKIISDTIKNIKHGYTNIEAQKHIMELDNKFSKDLKDLIEHI